VLGMKILAVVCFTAALGLAAFAIAAAPGGH
jgi:hypothetical protein